MLKVVVELLRDRTKPGIIQIYDGEKSVLGPFLCLGKADNQSAKKAGNPDRNPEYRMGDTPTGDWLITKVIPTGTPGLSVHSYGHHGALDLKPVRGSCLAAYQNGRTGIWIHGGAPNAAGKMRPTHGCIRFADPHMKSLVQLLRSSLPENRIPMVVSEA